MAKRGKYQPDRMQEPTPEAKADLRARRSWFMGLGLEERCKLVAQTRAMGTRETGEYYRRLWLDAGRPG